MSIEEMRICMKQSNSSLRTLNTQRVLSEIINAKEISRVDISQKIALNKASTSEITRDLINRHIIIEVGTGESSQLGGKRPTLLALNPNAGVGVGIDIGVNTVRNRVTKLNGQEIESSEFHNEPESLLSDIKAILEKYQDKYSKLHYGIVACTISIQGVVHQNKILFTPNYNVVEIESIVPMFSFPIYFENEANLAALAHKEHNDLDAVAAITLRTGIGSGILFKNSLYKGYESGAGEIGHTLVYPNGLKCPCGNNGCLEQYASENSILKLYRERKQNTSLTLNEYINACNTDDEVALEILDDALFHLSIGITNFVSLYATPTIYIVGKLSNEIPFALKSLRSKIKGVYTRDLVLLNSIYGKDASAQGACIHSVERFLDLIS